MAEQPKGPEERARSRERESPADEQASAPSASRGAGRLHARHADFRRLLLGTAVSLLGSSVTGVALPLTAAAFLHASAGQMGLPGAPPLLPHLLIGLPAGAWAERAPYRRILVTADVTQGLLPGAVPVLAACGLLRIWRLWLVAVLAGAGNLFETATAQSFTPLLVPRDRLPPANSALTLTTSAVVTTGSALGGLRARPALPGQRRLVVPGLRHAVARRAARRPRRGDAEPAGRAGRGQRRDAARHRSRRPPRPYPP